MLPRLQKHITTDGAEMRYAPAMYCTPRPSDHKHIYATHNLLHMRSTCLCRKPGSVI